MKIALHIEPILQKDRALFVTGNAHCIPFIQAGEVFIAATLSEKGEYQLWNHTNKTALIDYLSDHVIVGWGIDNFEIPVLLFIEYQTNEHWRHLNSFDLSNGMTALYTRAEIAELNNIVEPDTPDIDQLFAAREFEKVYEYAKTVCRVEMDMCLRTEIGLKFPAKMKLTEGWILRYVEPRPDSR